MRPRSIALLFVALIVVSAVIFVSLEAQPGDSYRLQTLNAKKNMVVRCLDKGNFACNLTEIEAKRSNSTR